MLKEVGNICLYTDLVEGVILTLLHINAGFNTADCYICMGQLARELSVEGVQTHAVLVVPVFVFGVTFTVASSMFHGHSAISFRLSKDGHRRNRMGIHGIDVR